MGKAGGGDAGGMHPSVRRLNERFPHVRERAVCLFERDETFRELCEDYEMCAVSVERLKADDLAPVPLREEYAALLLRLERELLRHLEEHPDREGS